MDILFLCNKSPWPPREGAPLAMNANIQALLRKGHRVKVLALSTNKYPVSEKDIPQDYLEKTGIEFVYVDLSVRPWPAFKNLFSLESFHVARFDAPAVHQRLSEILLEQNFDIVQIEILYMLPYLRTIRKYSNAPVVLRSHNVEHLLWKRIAATTSNPLRRSYLRYLARKLERYELSSLNDCDGLATISPKDAGFFREAGCTLPLTDIPFGVDPAGYPFGPPPKGPLSLFHIGSMNWMPNEEGIAWFLEKVWPEINRRWPELPLYLAGREMPDWILELEKGTLHVPGEVPDAREFMAQHHVMVVPLRSGSGIRIKIIEAMAMGKAIISTSLGAEGINCTHGKNILIADTPDEMTEAVRRCMDEPGLVESLGKEARKLIETEHNLESVGTRLEDFYRTVAENSVSLKHR
ncbi:MAG: glycosyltransferase [Bacteroidales bacterium]